MVNKCDIGPVSRRTSAFPEGLRVAKISVNFVRARHRCRVVFSTAGAGGGGAFDLRHFDPYEGELVDHIEFFKVVMQGGLVVAGNEAQVAPAFGEIQEMREIARVQAHQHWHITEVVRDVGAGCGGVYRDDFAVSPIRVPPSLSIGLNQQQ